MEKINLLPCPFCNSAPVLRANHHGSEHDIACNNCGIPCVSVHIFDLMSAAEVDNCNFTNGHDITEYINRAKANAATQWNTRATTKNWRNNSEHKKPAEAQQEINSSN